MPTAETISECLSYIVLTLVAQQVAIGAFTLQQLADAMQHDAPSAQPAPPATISAVAEQFSCEPARDGTRAIDVERVARWVGTRLLQTSGSTLSEAAFIAAWRELMPDALRSHAQPLLLSLDTLRGLHIVTEAGLVVYYPAHALPHDAAARYAALFRLRDKWKQADLWAFVADLAPTRARAEALMLKFARKQTENGEQYLTSRSKWTREAR